MRKFKHTPTNREFTVKEIGCNAVEGITWGDWEIPMWILENGQDWKEIIEKEVLLTTEDGVEIYGGEKLHLVTKCFTLGVGLNFTKDDLKDKDYLFFAKKENAEKYIELNSPKYSVLDMLKVANHYAYIKNVTEDKILKYLAKNEIR